MTNWFNFQHIKLWVPWFQIMQIKIVKHFPLVKCGISWRKRWRHSIKNRSDLMNQYMSSYQQRWRNVYTNGSFLSGGRFPWNRDRSSLASVVRCAPGLPARGRGGGTVHLQFGVVAEEVPLFGGTVQRRVRLGEHETVPILKNGTDFTSELPWAALEGCHLPRFLRYFRWEQIFDGFVLKNFIIIYFHWTFHRSLWGKATISRIVF